MDGSGDFEDSGSVNLHSPFLTADEYIGFDDGESDGDDADVEQSLMRQLKAQQELEERQREALEDQHEYEAESARQRREESEVYDREEEEARDEEEALMRELMRADRDDGTLAAPVLPPPPGSLPAQPRPSDWDGDDPLLPHGLSGYSTPTAVGFLPPTADAVVRSPLTRGVPPGKGRPLVGGGDTPLAGYPQVTQLGSPALGQSPAQRRVPKRDRGLNPYATEWRRPDTIAGETGARAIVAKRAQQIAEQDVVYWTNRVRMLTHEMDKTITKIEAAKRANDICDVSSALNARTQQALEEQRVQQERELEIKRHQVRLQRQVLKKNTSTTLASHYEEKRLQRDYVKMQAENNMRIIEQMKYEDLEHNIERKEAIQQQKIIALLKRVKDRAQKEEEAQKKFSKKIEDTLAVEHTKQTQAMQMIRESAVMMHYLKKLKDEQSAVQARAVFPTSSSGGAPLRHPS